MEVSLLNQNSCNGHLIWVTTPKVTTQVAEFSELVFSSYLQAIVLIVWWLPDL